MKVKKETGRTWPDQYFTWKRLGKKTKPYVETEEEMLMDKEYTYESLSKEEKKMFNKLKPTKNGNR